MAHLLVTGGTGFLGRAIGRLASLYNISVVSISRSGKPEGIRADSYKSVTWVAADIFKPDDWKSHLEGCSAVIHCIGIVEERPGSTYAQMILGAAKVVSCTAKANGVNKFVFISAGAAAPDTPAAYMEHKIAAETFLSSHELGLDLNILKPGMLYGEERPETVRENEHIQQLLSDPALAPEMKANRPLPVESVAKVALYAATHELAPVKLSVDDMEQLTATIRFQAGKVL